MVVNWLLHTFSGLKSSYLFVHKVEVILQGVKGSKSRNLTSSTVVKVEVIKADYSGKIRNKSVGFPSTFGSESSSKRSNWSQ